MKKPDFAVYLPAVNTLYAQALTAELPAKRPFPKGLSLSDLEFWNESAGKNLWHYPYFLHSVGQYRVGELTDNAVTRRGRTDGVMVGDSGGFQIGNGNLTGLVGLESQMDPDEACAAWRENIDARLWILNWLETYSNYAITIDMPLWAATQHGVNSPFHRCSPEQLIQLTVENLQFIDSHRQGRTKWLNVVQGATVPAITQWWDAVKWFPCSGYAMSSSGGRAVGLHALLEPLLLMRDQGAFVPGRDWIHLLGVSTVGWAVVLSAIQKVLRSTVNPEMTVSYDSAAPFQDAAIREQFVIKPELQSDTKSWIIRKAECPQSRLHVGSDVPVPFSSAIADKLTLGHLSVKDGMYEAGQFDITSRALLSNHNVRIYLDSFEEANRLVSSNSSRVPQLIAETVDLIDRAFKAEAWKSVLDGAPATVKAFRG